MNITLAAFYLYVDTLTSDGFVGILWDKSENTFSVRRFFTDGTFAFPKKPIQTGIVYDLIICHANGWIQFDVFDVPESIASACATVFAAFVSEDKTCKSTPEEKRCSTGDESGHNGRIFKKKEIQLHTSGWTDKMFEEWLNLYLGDTANRRLAYELASKTFKIHFKNRVWENGEFAGWKTSTGMEWNPAFWYAAHNCHKTHTHVEDIDLLGYEKTWLVCRYMTYPIKPRAFAHGSLSNKPFARDSQIDTLSEMTIIALRHRCNPRSVTRQLFGRPDRKEETKC